MKYLRLLCLVLALLCPALGAQAAKKPEYTLSRKNNTVLQSVPDRSIAVRADTAVRPLIPGESPVTGLPWDGEYLPMLVQIGNDVGNSQANGYKVQSAGIGNRTPWGIQYADILYEELTSVTGSTRFIALFSDSLAQGEPAAGTGPVRSCRIGPVLLRAEWQCGLIYAGNFAGENWERLLWETDAMESGAMLDTHKDYAMMGNVVKGVKTPNYNTYVVQNRALIPGSFVSTPHPFLFQDGGAYSGGYQKAGTVNLDWGYKYQISHFVYDEQEGAYTRWCGAGTDPKKWVLFAAFPTAEEREEADRIPIAYANVIVQRVNYLFENAIRPVVQAVGQGNADIFIDGKYIPGTWARPDLESHTVYYDDQGNELRLNRGKTFIALFPNEARCTFTAD